jgi:hypothetical protein
MHQPIELYTEEIPPESIEVLLSAKEVAKKEVEKIKLKIGKYDSYEKYKTPIVVKPIPPGDGVINGFTDGNVIGINAYIVPKTKYFSRFSSWLSELKNKNRFAKYLYEKTIVKPVRNLIETLVHEYLHKETQFKIKYGNNGEETNFISDVYKATTEYLEERLPKFFKPFAKKLAKYFVVPVIEGVNEALTKETLNEPISEEPTTYDIYARYARKALEALGYLPSEFYRDYFKNGNSYYNVKNLVKKFYSEN